MSLALPCIEEIDYSQFVTEDGAPVDNMFSEKQRWLLTEALNSSWNPGRPFITVSDVGIFYEVSQPPLVPDVLLSMDVVPAKDIWMKKNRSYFIWVFGKPPEVVIEIVSNKEGGEGIRKLQKYAYIGIRYYIIFDPQRFVQNDVLRIYELHGNQYFSKIDRYLSDVGLGIILWNGVCDRIQAQWLRWCDRNGNLIPIGRESAELERQRANQERQRAERLAQKLKELGIEFD